MGAVKVEKISDTDLLQVAYNIRKIVFVEEQKVPIEEEIDDFERVSVHFLAWVNQIPCGAARWRFTENGVKLERFAVLKEYRRMGVGAALVQSVIEDIEKTKGSTGKQLYLHAQLGAVPLYENFNFIKEGEIFEECEIQHYKMVRK